MRILHVSKKYVGVIGGDGAVVAALRAEQEAAGDQVWVVTSRCADILDDPRVIKIGVRDTPEELDRVGPRRLTSLAMFAAGAGRILDQVKPDVVHSHSLDMGAAVARAAAKRKIPVINTCHIVEAERPGSPLWKRRAEQHLIRQAQFNRVVVLNSSCANAFQSKGVKDLVHIPNGFDPLPLPARADWQGPLRLVAVGRLEDDKGFDILIDAFAKVEAARSGCSTLKIVGSGSKLRALQRQAVHLNVDVIFTGAVNPEAMPGVWADADVYVMSSRFETGPISFYEAWGAQVAAVAAKVGMLKDLGRQGEDVLLFEPCDVDGLANAILMLIDDPPLVEKLARNGRKALSGVPGWSETAAQYRKLYESLIG